MNDENCNKLKQYEPILEPVFSILDFPTYDRGKAERVADVLNNYLAVKGNWNAVMAKNLVSRQTLWRYLQEEPFNEALQKIKNFIVQMAESTVLEVMNEGNHGDRLKAAKIMLEAHRPEVYDLGYRREKARVGTSMLKDLFKSQIAPGEAKYIEDPVDALRIKAFEQDDAE